MGFTIAIDGPAGAGKSTVARQAAGRLGFLYVDTGALYRAMALYLTENGVDLHDEDAVGASVSRADVTIRYEDGEQQVFVNGRNVTSWLRTEEVSRASSLAAAHPQVRAALLTLQRDLAAKEDVLMDGRDIGTHVLPDADLKIYLTADMPTRVRRRYLERKEKGERCDPAEIEREIRARDERDMTRPTAPLRRAADAVEIDSSDKSVEQVTEEILGLVNERRRGQA